MLQKDPLPKIIPTIAASLFLYGDSAISQTGDRGIVAIPPQNTQGGLPELLGAGVGGAVIVAAFIKLFEKYGTNFIDGQKSRLNLEIESRKLELELKKEERLSDREESKAKDKIIESTLNLALSNLAQGARDSHEANYLLAEKMELGNELHRISFSEIANLLTSQDKRLASLENKLGDVLNVLKLKNRGAEQ